MKRFAIAALALVVVGALVAPANAQQGTFPDPLGTLYMSVSNTEYVGEQVEVATFAPFPVYILTEIDFGDVGLPNQNSSNGLIAWEGRMDYPAEVSILGTTRFPATAQDFGSNGTGYAEYRVGLGAETVLNNQPFVLAQLSVLLLSPTPPERNTRFRLGPTVIANPTVAGVANWVEISTANGCESSPGQPTRCKFAYAETGDLKLTTGTEIDTPSDSWGGLKSRFDR